MLLLLGEKFWHPSCWLLYEAKILMKYGLDCAYGGTSHFGKRCLIFTRWSAADGGGRNKATGLFVLMVFLVLKGHQSKVCVFNKAHYCLILASTYGLALTSSSFFQVNGLCNTWSKVLWVLIKYFVIIWNG
jgi:hypothetical protein